MMPICGDRLQGRMVRGIHRLLKVSPVPAMPDPSTPCRWATLEMAITEMAVSGVAHLQGGRPAAVFYPLGYPTPYGPDRLVRRNGASPPQLHVN
jgi:hypothetical protein